MVLRSQRFGRIKTFISLVADRFNIIFSTSSRKDMSKELGMSDQVLQNCFTKLRKKKLIVNNSIPKNRQVFIENELLVVLKLELKDV